MTGLVDALTSWSIDEVPRPLARPWEAVLADIHRINFVLRPNADYDTQAALLPGLVQDLIVATATPARHEALVALLSAYKAAAYLAHDLGVAGLPALAAERMRQVAEELDDPVWLSYARYQRAQLLTGINRARQYDLAVQVADIPGARIETRGMAHLTAALSTAVRGDGDSAQSHLAEAAQLADQLEPETSPWMQTNFGRTNVGIWRVSIGVELGAGPGGRRSRRRCNSPRCRSRVRPHSGSTTAGVCFPSVDTVTAG
ncbi:hypothetical protein [Actinokineospora sp.]|uniref:hypothetical protein n=1 Tax=Actinokineospora sp. TaxID=1872133 RepID=UPI003D6BDB26